MKRIKWENVAMVVMGIVNVITLVSHIKLNGMYFELLFEVVIDLMFMFATHYTIRNFRKNPLSWK